MYKHDFMCNLNMEAWRENDKNVIQWKGYGMNSLCLLTHKVNILSHFASRV